MIIDQMDGTFIDIENVQTVEHFLKRTDRIIKILSKVNRYGGKLKYNWSVLQHTILFYELYSFYSLKNYPEDKLWILIHEFFEAITVDIITPLKKRFPEYKKAEDKALSDLAMYLFLPDFMSNELKEWDGDIAIIEAIYLSEDSYLREIPKVKENVVNTVLIHNETTFEIKSIIEKIMKMSETELYFTWYKYFVQCYFTVEAKNNFPL